MKLGYLYTSLYVNQCWCSNITPAAISVQRTVLIFLMVIGLLGGCASGSVSDSRSVISEQTSAQNISLDFLHALPGFVDFQKSGLTLELISSNTDQLGMTHLRYAQSFNGVPLLDAQIITHVKDAQVYRMDGALARLKLSSAVPDITGDQALDAALAYRKSVPDPRNEQHLVIIGTGNRYSRLAWLVTIRKGLERFIVLVDAHTGSVIRELPGMIATTQPIYLTME